MTTLDIIWMLGGWRYYFLCITDLFTLFSTLIKKIDLLFNIMVIISRMTKLDTIKITRLGKF